MDSRASFFNPTMFKKCVARFWPLWCAYILVWIFCLPIPMISNLRYGEFHLANVAETPLTVGTMGGAVICCVFAVLAAMCVYSFAYNARSTSFFSSLPLSRSCLFVSAFSAGAACMLGGNVLVFLLTLAVEAIFGAVYIGYLLQWLTAVCLLTLLFFGFASLCAVLTGSLFILPAVYAILLFTVWGVEGMTRYILSSLFYGMNDGSYIFSPLSPVIHIFQNTMVEGVYPPMTGGEVMAYSATDYVYSGWLYLILCGVAGLVFAVCALAIFKKRRMESAGDVVAVRPLRPVFKYCLSLGCALVVGTIVNSLVFDGRTLGITPALFLMAAILFGAFIGYFAAEMLNHHTLRVFGGKHWLGFGVTAAVLLALSLSCELDVWGYETRIPEASEVENVFVSVSGESAVFETPENIDAAMSLHKSIVACKTANESSDRNRYMRIEYELKDGGSLSRNYNIDAGDIAADDAGSNISQAQTLLNSVEGIMWRKRTSFDVTKDTVTYAQVSWNTTPYEEHDEDYYDEKYPAAADSPTIMDGGSQVMELTDAEAVELYTCIERDMAAGTIGLIWLTDVGYGDSVYDCCISIDLRMAKGSTVSEQTNYYGQDEYIYNTFYTYPTVWSQNTNAWLTVHGVELATMAVTSAG